MTCAPEGTINYWEADPHGRRAGFYLSFKETTAYLTPTDFQTFVYLGRNNEQASKCLKSDQEYRMSQGMPPINVCYGPVITAVN